MKRWIWEPLRLPADHKHAIRAQRKLSGLVSTIWKQFASVIHMVLSDSFVFYSLCKKCNPPSTGPNYTGTCYIFFSGALNIKCKECIHRCLRRSVFFLAIQLMQIFHWGPYIITIRNFLKIKMEKQEEIYLITLLSKHFTY